MHVYTLSQHQIVWLEDFFFMQRLRRPSVPQAVTQLGITDKGALIVEFERDGKMNTLSVSREPKKPDENKL